MSTVVSGWVVVLFSVVVVEELVVVVMGVVVVEAVVVFAVDGRTTIVSLTGVPSGRPAIAIPASPAMSPTIT